MAPTSLPVVKFPSSKTVLCITWVCGLMAINVGCEFHDRGSIPNVCQIADADLGQVS